MSVGVVAGEVQEVYTRENDEESTEQRYRIDCICGVESLEKDEGGAKGRGCEGDVVERIHTGRDHTVSIMTSFSSDRTYIEVENEFNALLK